MQEGPAPKGGPQSRAPSRRRNVIWIMLGSALILLCVGGVDACSSKAPSTSRGSAAESTHAATPKPTATSRCASVPDALANDILGGNEPDTGALRLVQAAAWRSPDFTKVWFVAIKFKIQGGDELTGVWATNSLEAGGGLILAVDGFAKEFTVWPDADKTAARISGGDPGIDASESCLK